MVFCTKSQPWLKLVKLAEEYLMLLKICIKGIGHGENF